MKITGIYGREYEVIEYDHITELDLHFKLNGNEYVLPVSTTELRELSIDLSKVCFELQLAEAERSLKRARQAMKWSYSSQEY